MTDQARDNEPDAEVAENAQPEVVEKVYRCNYCDKFFYSFQALGGHQNAHQKERVAKKRPMEQNYDPYHPWTMPPPPPPPSFSLPYPSTLNHNQLLLNNLYGSNYNNPSSSQPHLRHHPYYPLFHQYGSTSQYQLLRNHLFGTNATTLPPVNPSLNIPSVPTAMNPSMNILVVPSSLNLPSMPSSYGAMNQNAQHPLLGRGLNNVMRQSATQWRENNPIEQGSSSGVNQGKGGAEKEDGKKELDLTLRL